MNMCWNCQASIMALSCVGCKSHLQRSTVQHIKENPMNEDTLQQELAVRRMVERWAVWRDAGDWERFRTVWHPDGRMMATWTQGTGDEFIEISKQAWARGVSI